MALIILTNSDSYQEGKPAQGIIVRADMDLILAQANGNLDGNNISDSGVDSDQLAANSVISSKLGANAVLEANVHFGASTGLLVARAGPSYAGNGVPRLAVVNKQVTWGGGVTDDITFTYASDCAFGNPGFTDVPYLMGMPVVATVETVSEFITSCFVTAASNLAITMTLTHATSSADVRIQFGVFGQIATP